MTDLAPPPDAFALDPDWTIVAPTHGEIVYRIVEGEPVTLRDFKSNRDKGEMQRWRQAREDAIEYLGISVFATEEQAREMAARFPRIGNGVAAVSLSDDMRFARTRRTPGHHTAWGAPEAFLEAASLI